MYCGIGSLGTTISLTRAVCVPEYRLHMYMTVLGSVNTSASMSLRVLVVYGRVQLFTSVRTAQHTVKTLHQHSQSCRCTGVHVTPACTTAYDYMHFPDFFSSVLVCCIAFLIHCVNFCPQKRLLKNFIKKITSTSVVYSESYLGSTALCYSINFKA